LILFLKCFHKPPFLQSVKSGAGSPVKDSLDIENKLDHCADDARDKLNHCADDAGDKLNHYADDAGGNLNHCTEEGSSDVLILLTHVWHIICVVSQGYEYATNII
jgi:hypothetical protein